MTSRIGSVFRARVFVSLRDSYMAFDYSLALIHSQAQCVAFPERFKVPEIDHARTYDDHGSMDELDRVVDEEERERERERREGGRGNHGEGREEGRWGGVGFDTGRSTRRRRAINSQPVPTTGAEPLWPSERTSAREAFHRYEHKMDKGAVADA